MKINFKQLTMTDLEGNKLPLDCAKQIANFIYSETPNLEDLILAQDIYKNGEIELTDEQIDKIKNILKKGFKAFVQKAFEDTVNENKSVVKEIKE